MEETGGDFASRMNKLPKHVDFTYVATWTGFVYVAFCVDASPG